MGVGRTIANIVKRFILVGQAGLDVEILRDELSQPIIARKLRLVHTQASHAPELEILREMHDEQMSSISAPSCISCA